MKSLDFWVKYGWIKRGKQRKDVIKLLPNKPITAEEFRKEINAKANLKLSLREMSRHFTSFTKQGIMQCLTPKEPYGKLYLITELGKKIQKEILKRNTT